MMNEKEQGEMRPLLEKLRNFERKGIPIYLENKSSTPEEVIRAYQVREDVTFMADYVADEKDGHLLELHFDAIRESQDIPGNHYQKSYHYRKYHKS